MFKFGIIALHQPERGRFAVVACLLERTSIEEVLIDTRDGDVTRSYVTENVDHWHATRGKEWVDA